MIISKVMPTYLLCTATITKQQLNRVYEIQNILFQYLAWQNVRDG